MATTANIGEDGKRTDLFLVNPSEIHVEEDNRGRFTPPAEADIVDLATSIFDYTQLEPVLCTRRTIEDVPNRLQLVMGYTRMAASRLIRDGFTGSDGKHRHQPDFLIKVVLTDLNDQESFIANIIENAHRNQASPIDTAHNQRKLRQGYGYDDNQIAALYNIPKQQVEQLAQLLQLSDEHRQLVHEGTLPVSSAISLISIPEEQRSEIISKSEKTKGGKVKGSSVAKQVREKHLRDPKKKVEPNAPRAKKGEAKKQIKARSVKEIREFFEVQSRMDTGSLADFAKLVVSFCSGTVSDDDFRAEYDLFVIRRKKPDAEAVA